MNAIATRQLEMLGEYGYFEARLPSERKSAAKLCRLMSLVEREESDGHSVKYTYRLRQAAINSVQTAYPSSPV